ncbi:MAG: transposase [Pseudomonadota bacterium]
MSCYVRPKVSGARVFFTVNLAHRGSTLLVDEIDHLREAVRQTREERPFEIDAFVVLPDHIHAVWAMPRGDRDFGTRWGAIKARFSASIRRAGFTPPPRLPVVTSGRFAGVNPGLRRDKGELGIWQRRFWEHHIRDEADYWMHVRYCWLNPVKHGLIARPEEWPYSSVHRDARFEVGMDLEV